MAGPARQVRGCHDALWGKSAVCLLIGASRRCSEVLAFIRCLGCAIHAYAAVHACAVCCIMFQVDVSALETSTACKSDVTKTKWRMCSAPHLAQYVKVGGDLVMGNVSRARGQLT
jgi:hypothetical protein